MPMMGWHTVAGGKGERMEQKEKKKTPIKQINVWMDECCMGV